MSTMKKFFKYFLVFIIFYFASTFLSNKIIESTYKPKKLDIDFDTPSIEISEAKATSINGYLKGRLTNNSGERLTGKYIKADFFSPRGINIGTRYIKLNDLNPGESVEIDERVKFNNIDSIKLSMISQEEKPNEKLLIEKIYDKISERIRLSRYRRLVENIKAGDYKDIAKKIKDGNFNEVYNSILNDIDMDENTRAKIIENLDKARESLKEIKEQGLSAFSIKYYKFPWYIWLAALIVVFG